MMKVSLWFLTGFCIAQCPASTSKSSPEKKKKIAIIGGGIGGSFTAHYLATSDTASCKLNSITIFDPVPIMDGAVTKEEFLSRLQEVQGSRVQSLKFENDETVVELGASIIYGGNKLVKEMVENDPEHLTECEPGTDNENGGFGIWNGKGWQMTLTQNLSLLKALSIFYRYNIDLIKISKAVDTALKEFDMIYKYLDSSIDDISDFLDSPDKIWDHCGGFLRNASSVSFDDLLDQFDIPDTISGLRSFIPGQGSLRNELLMAINIVNYNQYNNEMNGLAGLVSSVPVVKGNLFSIKEGNAEIIISAINQGNNISSLSLCRNDDPLIEHVQSKISTVVVSNDMIELESDRDEFLGSYDIVVIAVPLQHAKIDFKFRHGNETLHTLDLATLSSSKRIYQQTITTVISNATLSEKFSVSSSTRPRSVYFTKEGKELEGISSISDLGNGTFKMFSSEIISNGTMETIFGDEYSIEFMKVWGGNNGGAYPKFDGGGDSSPPFLLYESKETGSALYYTSAMEALVSAMEISAIGAKSTVKLISKRLGLQYDDAIRLKFQDISKEEL